AAAGVCAMTWVPGGALIARWFPDRAGSMMGLAFSGMGTGVLVLGPLAQWLIARQGWRGAYVAIGIGVLVILVPLIWFGIQGPAGPRARAGRAPSAAAGAADWQVGAALRTKAFWALFFAYLCTPLAVFPVVTHSVAFAVDQGFPRLFV